MQRRKRRSILCCSKHCVAIAVHVVRSPHLKHRKLVPNFLCNLRLHLPTVVTTAQFSIMFGYQPLILRFEGLHLVQVQHPGLRDSYAVDVATVSIIVQLIHLAFPAFDYSWLVSEIRNTLPMVSLHLPPSSSRWVCLIDNSESSSFGYKASRA